MYFFCLPGQKVLPVVLDHHEAISHVMFRYSALVLVFLPVAPFPQTNIIPVQK